MFSRCFDLKGWENTSCPSPLKSQGDETFGVTEPVLKLAKNFISFRGSTQLFSNIVRPPQIKKIPPKRPLGPCALSRACPEPPGVLFRAQTVGILAKIDTIFLQKIPAYPFPNLSRILSRNLSRIGVSMIVAFPSVFWALPLTRKGWERFSPGRGKDSRYESGVRPVTDLLPRRGGERIYAMTKV